MTQGPRRAFGDGFTGAWVGTMGAFGLEWLVLSEILGSRFPTVTDRAIFAVLFLALALATALAVGIIGGGIGLVGTAFRSRRSQIVGVGGLTWLVVMSAYLVAHSEIDRGLNFVWRRIDPQAPYVMDPPIRGSIEVLALALVPAAAIALCFDFLRGWRTKALNASSSLWRRLTIVACVCLSAAAMTLNHRAYVHNYRLMHGLLAVLSAAALILAYGFQRPQTRRAVTVRLLTASGGPLLAVVIVASVALHFSLAGRYVPRTLLWQHSVAAREALSIVWSLADADGDGVPRLFGGGDDDGDRRIHPGRLEIAGNGIDDNGFDGDLVLDVDRATPGGSAVPPGFEPVDRVLFVTVDALRADRTGFTIGKDRSRTPRLDEFAARSLTFRRASSHASFTRFAFGAIWASWLPWAFEDDQLSADHLPAWLADQGVDTAGIATRFFSVIGFESIGFNRISMTIDDSTSATTGRDTLEAALEELARPTSGPRFLWVHFFDPHGPYHHHGLSGADAEARYDAEVAYTDGLIGKLLDTALRSSATKTAVVFTGDHGDEFGEHDAAHHGSTLYSEATWIPLFVLAPGLAPRIVDYRVCHIDIAPTVTDLFGLRVSPRWMGRSLLGHASPDGDEPPREIMALTQKGVRSFIDATGRYKLISHRVLQTMEVYDLDRDPGERRNLADLDPELLMNLRRQRERAEARLSRRLRDLASGR